MSGELTSAFNAQTLTTQSEMRMLGSTGSSTRMNAGSSQITIVAFSTLSSAATQEAMSRRGVRFAAMAKIAHPNPEWLTRPARGNRVAWMEESTGESTNASKHVDCPDRIADRAGDRQVTS